MDFEFESPTITAKTTVASPSFIPPDLDANVDFQTFKAEYAIHHIAFRVQANGHNYLCPDARDPDEPPSLVSVDNHLNGRLTPTPWISIFFTWTGALSHANWYKATSNPKVLSVLIIDLFKLDRDHILCVDAAKLQKHISGYVSEEHKHEYLIYQHYPNDAMVAWMPTIGTQVDAFTPSGIVSAHSSFFDQAGGEDEEAIKKWVKKWLEDDADWLKSDTPSRVIKGLCT